MTDFPEAKNVAYTTIKTQNGYEWSFTMRTDSSKEMIEQIEIIEKVFISKKWEAQPIRSSFGKKKEVKYIEGKKCPKCGGRLVEKAKKDGAKYHKCENGKWNPTTGLSGCDYVDWLKPRTEEEYYGEY